MMEPLSLASLKGLTEEEKIRRLKDAVAEMEARRRNRLKQLIENCRAEMGPDVFREFSDHCVGKVTPPKGTP